MNNLLKKGIVEVTCIQSVCVSAVKLLYSIFMSIDTSMTSPNSHLFHVDDVAFN